MYYVNLVLKQFGFQQPEEPQDPEMQNLLHIIKFKFVAPRGYISPTEQLILNYQKRYEPEELSRFAHLCNENTPLETIFEELGFPIKPSQQILYEIMNQINILKNPGNSQLDFDFNQLLFSSPSSTSNTNNSNSNSNSDKSNSNTISDILIYGALHQGIAWIADLGNHKLNFVIELITIFLDFINSPQINTKNQIVNDINCIFSLIIKGFLNDYSLELTDSFVAAVLAYLIGSYSITETFSELFNSFFSRVINSNLPMSVSHILRVTRQFISEKRPFIQIEGTTNSEPDSNSNAPKSYSTLFKINVLSPLIKSLDSNLIELICVGSTSTPKFLENIRSLLDLLATSLCENIIESSNSSELKNCLVEIDDSPDLKVPDFKNNYSFLKEDTEIADLNYNSKELDPLIKVIGEPSKSLKDYLPQKSLNVIVLISGMFSTMNSKYVESFLNIIFSHVIENLGKQCYIELYAVLLFLFEKLDGKFSLSVFKNCFLSPVIFNKNYTIFNYEIKNDNDQINPEKANDKNDQINTEKTDGNDHISTENINDNLNEIDQINTEKTDSNGQINIEKSIVDDKDLKFSIIFDFRCFTFNIISSNSQTLLYQLLGYASDKSPYLFSEQILRVSINLFRMKLELFCSENINELLLNSSIQLQQMFMEDPSNMTRLARISIFEFYFKIIEDSTSFLLSSSSPIFSKCFFHFLFEPSLTTLFLCKLKNGFINSHISFTVPVFFKFVPPICEILDFIKSSSVYLSDERYTNLANNIIQCITYSLSHNVSLIYSFVQVFPSILSYVWKNPSHELLQECFSFLSILSQSLSSFFFSSEMFQLLSDIIRAVEGKEPSLQTQLKYYTMMSCSNQTCEDALYLIKAPQFIPLILVSYSQSTKLTKLIEYFTSLCKYSPSNCVACNKGDLDFLLLQILKYENSFEYNGYRVDFLIDLKSNNYESLVIIFNLISHIIFVKTNVVIVDQLFKLTLPTSQYFQPHLAQSILLLLLNSITTEVNKKRPIFDIYLNKPICQIKGLTDKEVNGNFTISLWLKLDIPLFLSFSEPLTLFSIDSSNKLVSFKVLVNGESLYASFKNLKSKANSGNKNGAPASPSSFLLIDQIPSNDWVLFTFDVVKQTNENKTAVYVYKFTNQVGIATFNNFNFPPNSKITLSFGSALCDKEMRPSLTKKEGNNAVDYNLNEKSIVNLNSLNPSASHSNYKIIGQLGPFCIFDSKSDLHNSQTFQFTSDPNFENFKSAIITSSNIIEYYLNSTDISNMNLNEIKNTKNKSKNKNKNKNSKNKKNSIDDSLDLKMERFEIYLSNLMHCGDCLNDVLFYVYDLNYLTHLLTFFTPKDYNISIQILEIILSCLSSSAFAQKKYISVPILAKSIPIVFKDNLSYKLYLTLFTSMTTFKYEPLINEFLDFIIFNFELWGNSDLQSIVRIMNHWTTSVKDAFPSTKTTFLKVSRLLSVFDILFFSESTPIRIENENENEKNDYGVQTNFKLREMCLLSSFEIGHTKEEVKQIRESFLNFIERYVQETINNEVASSILFHLFESSSNKDIKENNKAKTIVLLNMLDHLGPTIKKLDKKFQDEFVKPLQFFFNTEDKDIIIAAVFAIYSLGIHNDVHLLLSAASIQIQLISNYKEIFYLLLPHIKERCNLFSLICVLSLTLDQEERNKAVLIIKEILNDPYLSDSIEQSTCWSIWPIILGLYNTEYGSKAKYKGQKIDSTVFQTNLAIIVEFFANQILRASNIKDRVLIEFKDFLSVIHILANDWKTAAFEFESELTFALSKHIFASTDNNVISIRSDFLRIAFNNIFFSNIYYRNRALFSEFTHSPFYCIHLARRSTMPIPPQRQRRDSKERFENREIEELKEISSKNVYKEENDHIPPLNVNQNLNIDPELKHHKIRANSGIIEDICKASDSKMQNVPQRNLQDEKPPFDSFMAFSDFHSSQYSNVPTFQLRISEENKWIDSKLCNTLISMIPCVEKPHPILQIFTEIVEFIRISYPEGKETEINNETKNKLMNNLNTFVDIQNKIATLQESTFSISSKLVYNHLVKAFKDAQEMIFDGLTGINEQNEKKAVHDIEKELNRINKRHLRYKEVLNEVEQKFVFKRDPQPILQLYETQRNKRDQKEDKDQADNETISTFFKRDNCSCFDLCPVKTKPVIKEKSFKIWELRQTHSINDKLYCDIETQTEKVEDDENENDDQDLSEYKKSRFSTILPCLIIKPTKIKKATFLLSPYKMLIIVKNKNNKYQIPLQTTPDSTLKAPTFPNKVINIQFYKIMSIFKRKRYQKNTAIEIFLINGETYFIDFDPIDNDEIMNQLADHPLLSIQQVQRESTSSYFLENKQRTTSLWASGQMSNFTYLMALNTFSGRTFNDILQYPIFPLITDDMKKVTRNLSFPLSYQPKKKSQNEDEDEEEEEANEEVFEDSIFLEAEQMFHTSPVPSSTVEKSLIRMEPFTSYYLKMQSGRFKKFDQKVESSFKSFENTELPPEFYFCPEIFENINGFEIPDFSFNENCRNSCFELVYNHRKMLESDKVSMKLNKWIDLIWGCKQRGKLALKFRNYLHPFILEDVWKHDFSLLVEAKRQVLSMMKLYGTMPQQLFTDFHPQRTINKVHENKIASTNNDAQMNQDEISSSSTSFSSEFVVVQKKIHSIPIIYASCISDSCFITIDSRGRVLTCMINLSLPDLLNKEISRTPLKISHGTIMCPIEKGVLFLSPSNESISIFQYGSLHTYRFFTSRFIQLNSKCNYNNSINMTTNSSQINFSSFPTANTATNPTTASATNTSTSTTNANTTNENEASNNNENNNNNDDGNENSTNQNQDGNENANKDENENNEESPANNEETTEDTENQADANNNSSNEPSNNANTDNATTTTSTNTNATNTAASAASADSNAATADADATFESSGNFGYDNYYTNDDDFEVFIHSNLNTFADIDDNEVDEEFTVDNNDFFVIDSEAEQQLSQQIRIMHIMSMMDSSNSMFSGFDSIYGSQKYFLIVKDKSVINVYDTLTFPQKLGEIVILEDSILHCQVSQASNVIAVLSRSGLIHIHSLSTLQKTAVIDLSEYSENGQFVIDDNNSNADLVSRKSAILTLNHKRPKRMVITPRWCFIVVDFGCARFDVYSINGIKIKESKIQFLEKNTSSIYSWSAVSSLKDFDYVIFVDTKGNIGYFEAFEPSNTKILTQTNSTVCHMDYCRSEDCIYVITTQGYVIFIEHPFVNE